MNAPAGSNFSDCVCGLNIRKKGCASQPEEATHCQPPLLAAKSKSLSLAAKYCSPRRQSMPRSLIKNAAAIIRRRGGGGPGGGGGAGAAAAGGGPGGPGH